jgi:hypothetical protein
MEPMTESDLTVVIVLLPYFDDQIVCLGVAETYEIEIIRFRLA